jgi:hypothetical protein
MSSMILNTSELKKVLREAVNEGRVVYVKPHAETRMSERGFTRPDVERALKSGSHNEQKSGYQNGQWRYRITGKTVDGNSIEVAVEVTHQVVVVTVMGDE